MRWTVAMQHEAILDAVQRYYSDKFAAHGASAQGVDWNSEESQQVRFAQLVQLFRDEARSFSVNDLGCGYGAFAEYLERRGFQVSYTGCEVSPAMVEHARAAFRDRPWARFCASGQLEPADYSVASGIFNVKLHFDDGEWRAYVEATIDRLAAASTRGFAFNMLTSYSDPDRRRTDLYYADPCAIFDLCKTRYARNVALLHDYGLWEFTLVVRTAA